jgi:hypothetical protein
VLQLSIYLNATDDVKAERTRYQGYSQLDDGRILCKPGLTRRKIKVRLQEHNLAPPTWTCLGGARIGYVSEHVTEEQEKSRQHDPAMLLGGLVLKWFENKILSMYTDDCHLTQKREGSEYRWLSKDEQQEVTTQLAEWDYKTSQTHPVTDRKRFDTVGCCPRAVADRDPHKQCGFKLVYPAVQVLDCD